jgi:hypothetical protein
MDLDQIYEYEFSYMTQTTLLLFKEEPTLETVGEVRKILDIVTDVLVNERLKA